MKRLKMFFDSHPQIKRILKTILLGEIILSLLFLLYAISDGYNMARFGWNDLLVLLMIAPVLCTCLFVVSSPIIWTGAEVFMLNRIYKNIEVKKSWYIIDSISVLGGILYDVIFQSMNAVRFGSDWYETLYNKEVHTPVFTESTLTISVIAVIGIVGYLAATYIPLGKMSPLILVLAIAAMYLGTLESIVWGVQIKITALPLNCVLITARTMLKKIKEWNLIPHETYKIDRIPILGWCNNLLKKSKLWPAAAFLFMWPLLGIVIAVLILFGQVPDSVIRAWTQTSDWTLSQQTAPPNIIVDEHYLCTVAAGGHKKIVKPLRRGVRHGHEVTVNRQLCIANAFEQILEEKTPHLHRKIRNFYDTYGFPVARLIRSRYAADVIYYLMKPLEWMFLIVLYLADVNPENRIAIQYTGKKLEDFEI